MSLSKEQEQIRKQLSELFEGMMKTLYNEQGSQFRIDIIAEKPAQDFINAHADALNSGFQQVKMSDAMRRQLQRSNYIFSGIKTFHELNEAFPSLIDENGNRKPFEQFLNDVRNIDRTYNQNYLRAEYNFCQASADMAARWEGFEEDGDRYNLQYRTANDDKVRPQHAALHGVTLPISDPFWKTYYPPNGWNCRCTVVQVRKSKYPVTPHDEAMTRGAEATEKDTKGIFQFNPGIQQKTFPDYNPYTIKRCRDCDIAKATVPDGSPSGSKLVFIPENELCAACKLIRECYSVSGKQVKTWREELKSELPTQDRNAPVSSVQTGSMLQSAKVLDRFLSHCYNVKEIDAARYIWTHPEELRDRKPSPFGEGKDPNSEKDRKNLEKKKKRKVVGYNRYKFSYKGKEWNVKVEIHEKGFEQFYAIVK